jgi:hypothetical protein
LQTVGVFSARQWADSGRCDLGGDFQAKRCRSLSDIERTDGVPTCVGADAAGNDNAENLKVTTVYSHGRFEQVATSIAVLGRSELKSRIKNFRGRFKLDFTDDYLDAMDIDRLRHILLAALINAKSHD